MSEGDSSSFAKPAEIYDRFIGRYGRSLAASLLERNPVRPGWRVLDVGSGPGPLTTALAVEVGTENVTAVEPSEQFAEACRERVPGADVRVASAEDLPFPDNSFHATFSQLVVNFLDDPLAAVGEMRRVTRAGGPVVAAVWDYADGMLLLRTFWDVARELDPDRAAELDEGSRMRFCRPDELSGLWIDAGFVDTSVDPVSAEATYSGFEDLWAPFPSGIGPAGAYCASLGDAERSALKAAYRRRLSPPPGAFTLPARAWVVSGRVPV